MNEPAPGAKEKEPASGAKETEGRYSNYFEVGTNEMEFLLAFGQWYGQETEPSIHTRIVTTPFYAKEMSRLLEKSLAEYESKYGPITSRNSGPLTPPSEIQHGV
jgi:hypothetical protein